MSYSAFIAKAWDQGILSSVLLELTYQCNLDCFFCYNDRSLKGESLHKADYFQLLDDLAEMQVLHLVLSGGEPLAHPNFWAIGARARALGFVVRVKSNGHALNPTRARRLKEEIAPFLVELSLHGASAAVHDRQTSMPGSFERLLRHIADLKNLGLRLKLNCTLTAWNEHESEALYTLADQLECPLTIDPSVTPGDNGDTTAQSIMPSRVALRHLFQLQIARGLIAPPNAQSISAKDIGVANPTAKSQKHCGAGSSTLAIDPYGNVYPCVQWRRSLGNLHQRSIRDIWQGSAELPVVRQLTQLASETVAKEGIPGRYMGFCPGLAELTSGSPVQFYPVARQKVAAIQTLLGDSAESPPA